MEGDDNEDIHFLMKNLFSFLRFDERESAREKKSSIKLRPFLFGINVKLSL